VWEPRRREIEAEPGHRVKRAGELSGVGTDRLASLLVEIGEPRVLAALEHRLRKRLRNELTGSLWGSTLRGGLEVTLGELEGGAARTPELRRGGAWIPSGHPEPEGTAT